MTHAIGLVGARWHERNHNHQSAPEPNALPIINVLIIIIFITIKNNVESKLANVNSTTSETTLIILGGVAQTR